MYKIFASKSLIALTALSVALFSANTFAGKGKGKPGTGNTPADLDGRNIVEVALGANALLGEFDYLLGAVGCFTDEETGENPIVDLLTGEDKLTLFAPVDQAFIDLQLALNDIWDLGLEATDPSITCAVDSLYGDGTLFTILAYHVSDGRRFSNSVFNRNNVKEIEMLAGGSIMTTPQLTIVDGFYQTVNPVPSLININATNGVVHVIDTVMLPFSPIPAE
ncbi:MAG: fasciclin domain-containing protein [Lysobacterales bacterium]|jgi:uncharacterized surface protein with fasciclin (FAS1) repeats